MVGILPFHSKTCQDASDNPLKNVSWGVKEDFW
jgi:hypothetical protein